MKPQPETGGHTLCAGSGTPQAPPLIITGLRVSRSDWPGAGDRASAAAASADRDAGDCGAAVGGGAESAEACERDGQREGVGAAAPTRTKAAALQRSQPHRARKVILAGPGRPAPAAAIEADGRCSCAVTCAK